MTDESLKFQNHKLVSRSHQDGQDNGTTGLPQTMFREEI